MIYECENCGGNVLFSPKDKGNVCERCGSVFPIKYDYDVKKKDFSASNELNNTELLKAVKNVKCNSCGANMVLNKKEIKSICPYCGSSTIAEVGEQKISNIDAIVPFDFNKEDALIRFNDKVSRSFFANKKIFKGITKEDFNGVYVNAFVFDLNTKVQYNGVFSYTETYRNSKGESKSRTRYRNVAGVFDKFFNICHSNAPL
jgi:DNA-directed RNA polymerase subunit RPC12/RpoP